MWRSILVAVSLSVGPINGYAQPVDSSRPPVGGVASPQGAMVFYVARGAFGACGPNCSEWIAAEGTIQWDTHRRLIAALDRLGDRKLPVVLDVRGDGNMNVAVSMGRIIRERGLDAMVATTRVERCAGTSETDCFALKRGGGPLEASIDTWVVQCDVACVLTLAGGVHRTLPRGAKVVVSGRGIRNRLGLNVSEERREGLQAKFGEQFRLYLTQMGVDPEFIDIVDRNTERHANSELQPQDWLRLRIVTWPVQ
jgi:hypothetical protein